VAVTVKIGGQELEFERPRDVDESWVRRQLALSSDGVLPCVVVRVQTDDVNLRLATPACPMGGGVSRALRPDEQRVAELWDERGLNSERILPGQVIAFFARLERILEG
jgi:hypothetical protein